jgi:hypothetical protein
MNYLIDRFYKFYEWSRIYKWRSYLLVGFVVFSVPFLVLIYHIKKYGITNEGRFGFLITILYLLLIVYIFADIIKSKLVNEKLEWMDSRINFLLKHIWEDIPVKQPQNKLNFESEKVQDNELRWPWGNHSSKSLKHLALAGSHFWVNYDPEDPSTAPTNAMVADWLIKQHGVPTERAWWMARILRADGLPDGPRR